MVESASPTLARCVFLVRAGSFRELSVPWRRQQDVFREHFKMARWDDLVVAVSHGWHYQAHVTTLEQNTRSSTALRCKCTSRSETVCASRILRGKGKGTKRRSKLSGSGGG